MKQMMLKSALTGLLLSALALPALAQDSAGTPGTGEGAAVDETNVDLDSLLQAVQNDRFSETEQHRQREREFQQRRSEQQQLLRQARADFNAATRRTEQLERTRQENEIRITELSQLRDERQGQLKELFGVLQEAAGNFRASLGSSQTTLQYPDRRAPLTALLTKLAEEDLPSITEIEQLPSEMIVEAIQSGKVVSFPYEVRTEDGQAESVQLTRVGLFNLVANGKYYLMSGDADRVTPLTKQPSGRFTGTIGSLTSAPEGQLVDFALDPTRGTLLSVKVREPSLGERIQQGREVGYIILAMGAIAMLFVVERLVYLSLTLGKVNKQVKESESPNGNNPLGRVLMVFEENRNVDVETLELKLDEAILKETPRLERFLTLIKIVSAVAPLFGLLGTVTGMIATFQAITLYGTGDPKLMANGISQALVTTVLGLVVAIPTLLAHSFVAGMSKQIVHKLEEQSAGIIAVHAEKAHHA